LTEVLKADTSVQPRYPTRSATSNARPIAIHLE